MANDPQTWKVTGRVVGADGGAGLANVLVEVYDQDRAGVERIGSALTDDDGGFEVSFSAEVFRATGEADQEEQRPDLFCRVRSGSGELLAQTEVRPDAAREEAFLIVVASPHEVAPGELGGDRRVELREAMSLRELGDRYFRTEGRPDAERIAVVEQLKERNPEFAVSGADEPIAAGTRIVVPEIADVPTARDVLRRDVHLSQLHELGVDPEVAEILVDRLNVKGVAGLAKLDQRYLGKRFDRLAGDPCIKPGALAKVRYADVSEWVRQARYATRAEVPPEIPHERVRVSQQAQRHLAEIASVHGRITVVDYGRFTTIFQNQKLQEVKALLQKAGICDISRVGTLRLTHDIDLRHGLYLPEPRNLVDPALLGWLNAKFTDVVISTFSHTRVASVEWPVNEAVLIATELDLTDRRIVIDRSIERFIVIAERVVYGDGAEITYDPIPLVSATEHTAAAASGASYSGHGTHGTDGADGQVGFSGNPGHRAPTLEIYTLEMPGGLPDIRLDGQPGGRGGRGQTGGRGGNGGRGTAGEGFIVCTKRPGNGGDGGDGGDGGRGGIGGDGGDGGSLTVGVLTGNESQIYSRPTHLDIGGGPRGTPGPPGLGGAGGQGGAPGTNNWWELCGDGSRGRAGPAGSMGGEYPPHADPTLAANGITTGHGANEGAPGLLNPPVLYSRAEWDLLLNQPWALRLEPNRSVPSRSVSEDRRFVTVEGQNFTPSDTVRVDGGGVATTYLSDSAMRFEVEFDFEAGGHTVHVVQSDGDQSNQLTLTVLPRLNAATPTDVIPGQAVTLDGNGFSDDARIVFAGLNLAPSTVTPTQITFFVPSQNQLIDAGIGAGTRGVKVVNGDGSETATIDLDLTIPFPRILVPVIVHRIFSEDTPTLGTNATEADIRDFFVNSDTQAHRIGYTVNHVLSQAGIQCVLAEVRDDLVQDDWVSVPFPAPPNSELRDLSGQQNVDFHLNIYMLISFSASFAWGGGDGSPGSTDQTGAVWMPNLTDVGPGNATRNNWRSYVNALCHEIGHFLTLPHFCNPPPEATRTGAACVTADGDKIMFPVTGQGRRVLIAAEHAETRARAGSYQVP